jgi:membrane protein CcdC involved in cytochrome C biogenesis
VILGLAALRLGLRHYIGSLISVQQTAGLFFVLAFGMIVRWRTTLLLEYRRLVRTNH